MTKDLQYFENSANLSRRSLGIIAAGGAAAVAMLGQIRAANAAATDSLRDGHGVKTCGQGGLNPSDDDLRFFNEVGYKYIYSGAGGGPVPMSVDAMKAAKARYASAGITLHSIRGLLGGIGGYAVNKMLLDLPGRAEGTEYVKQFIKNTGKNGAGFDYTGSRLMITGVWENGEVDIRGGAMEREMDPTSPNIHGSDYLDGDKPGTPKPAPGLNTLYYGREYGYDEVMGNFKKYFVKEIVPVLEEEDVFMAFHGPDDPPVFESLGGVARILANYGRIKNMFAAANSDNVGIQFCAGTWNEGGPLMGKDRLDALKEFWALKKFREVHFRNVSSPPVDGKPHFHETFMDNGYYDYYKIMKTLVDMDYDGLVHLDHHPDKMPGSPYSYLAYAAGFMNACIVRARNEPKGTL